MFCTKCGQEVPEGNRFCEHCGAPMTSEEEVPVIVEAPAAEEVPVAPEVTEAPAAPVEDPGASTAKTAFILGLVGLIAGAICSCSCALAGGILPMICSILAIVFAYQAKQKSAAAGLENKKATTAMILGIAGIAVIVVFVIINMIFGAVMGATGFYEEIYNF